MSSNIQPWPIVRRGDTEHPVRTLQHLLRAHSQNIAVTWRALVSGMLSG